MSTRLVSLLAGVLVIVAFAGVWRITAVADEPAVQKHTVLFNITSGKEDLHRVTMALQLANHALDDGRFVVLFLNVRAPELARKDLPAVRFRENPPIQEMLQKLMDRGAQLIVCPHCMEVQNVRAEDLMAGASVATRATVFDPLDASAVVFSY